MSSGHFLTGGPVECITNYIVAKGEILCAVTLSVLYVKIVALSASTSDNRLTVTDCRTKIYFNTFRQFQHTCLLLFDIQE